jgi:hypothetical protein
VPLQVRALRASPRPKAETEEAVSKQSADKCGPVSHDEALNIAMGYIDHCFGNPEKPERRITHSIPANHARDSDLRLTAYIEQQRQKDEARSEASGGWNPVSSPPKKGSGCIGYDQYYGRVGEAYFEGRKNDFGEWSLKFIDSDDCHITHWMPLPKPPALPGAPRE